MSTPSVSKAYVATVRSGNRIIAYAVRKLVGERTVQLGYFSVAGYGSQSMAHHFAEVERDRLTR